MSAIIISSAVGLTAPQRSTVSAKAVSAVPQLTIKKPVVEKAVATLLASGGFAGDISTQPTI